MLEASVNIEPCGFEGTIPEALTDRVLELLEAASDLGRGLHPDSVVELRAMVRLMNTYFSNRIEGHSVRPTDIEAAIADHEAPHGIGPLTQEAVAHIAVQEWIDDLSESGSLPDPFSLSFLRDIHRRLYQAMPEDLRFTEHKGTRYEIIPGEIRAPGQEVVVGQHRPPPADQLPDFMAYFEKRYHDLTRGRTGQILSIPAAHHRLNYIHPFLDGNGRVSRLMTHAMVQKAGIGGHGLWSISRGLARGLTESGEYKARMAAAGRLDSLQEFTDWFLEVMLDQIEYAKAMFDLKALPGRYAALIRDLEPSNDRMLTLVDHVLRFGEMPRGAAKNVLGVQDRTARNVLAAAVREGFLKSSTPKAPVRIAVPLKHRERLFPNLFAGAASG